jgi:hypothetical protein
LINPLADKFIIIQVGIGGIHAIYFLQLSRAESFLRIQAPDSLQQSLPAQNFMQSCDTSKEIVGHVEEGCV